MSVMDYAKTGFTTVKNFSSGIKAKTGNTTKLALNKIASNTPGLNVGPVFKTSALSGIGLTIGAKGTGWANNRINSTLQNLYPENMLPTSQGRFGKRVDGLSQSPVQGVKFNFRRK